jgi:hypothetical protein
MGTTGVHLLTHTALLSRWMSLCQRQNHLSLLEIKKKYFMKIRKHKT